MKKLFSIWVLFVCLVCKSVGQQVNDLTVTDSISGKDDIHGYSSERLSIKSATKYTDAMSSKSEMVSDQLDKRSQKALQKLYDQEMKIKKKLNLIDSGLSKNLFSNLKEKYQRANQTVKSKARIYVPGLDSMKTTLGVLGMGEGSPVLQNNVKEALGKIDGLEASMQKSLRVQEFINERKQILTEQLSSLGFYKEIKIIQKQAYYFKQQFEEYKTMLNDEKKIERKVLEIVRNTSAFQNILKKNSALAGLFVGGGTGIDPAMLNGITGLQTRNQVNQVLQTRLSGAGQSGSPQQFVQTALQSSQSAMSQLSQRVSSLGGQSGDFDIPSFKPNGQKGKSFWRKFEVSANMQSSKANNLFPMSTDFGLALGFKPVNKLVVGVGASVRIGWGSGFKNIKVSSQGLGLRSFIDYKVKQTFYLSGGFEANYFSEIRHIRELKNHSGWKQSALLGVSKKYKVGKNKNGELKMLYDFFARTRVPVTNPFVFRVGLGFNKL